MAKSYQYQAEVRHDGLNKYKVLKAASTYELRQKINMLEAQWNEQWEKKCFAETKRLERELKLKNIEESLEIANNLTQDAEKVQEDLNSMLYNSLNPIPLKIESLKDFKEFSISEPSKVILKELPVKPERTDCKYNPKIPFIKRIFSKNVEEVEAKNNQLFIEDLNLWEDECNEISNYNSTIINSYEESVVKWTQEKEDYINEQKQNNEEIDRFLINFKRGKTEAIERYYSLILNQINIHIDYDRDVDIEYNQNNKILIIDFTLPAIESLPNLKKVDYIKSREEYKEYLYSEAYLKKTYDKVIYQIVLLTLNNIFKLDKGHQFIDAIVFNGQISTIDKSTGNAIEPYVLSINTSKDSFSKLNLEAIDPKAWFKSAKGVSASTFANITPVAPIIQISTEDSRFIDGYSVIADLDNSTNLAAMDWQDFENLIRELFEQEFNVDGGEVNITQASRDGGVDAIAFDPDPIRGGKIVIQAKRYTNVVGVSAVRDLYGTVMNEGATKGILVTTSNFGNDSYDFAQGKPLSLLNGAHLLSLLEKHGHRARINIKEAKEIMKEIN